MGDITQDQIAKSHAVDSLAWQISALGYTTIHSLQGMPRACTGEAGLKQVETLGLAFQAYCRGICDQMQAKSEHVDGGLNSAIFQLGAIGKYAIEHLAFAQIRLQGGEDRQRLFVAQTALAIQDACDSIAAQIGQELA